MTCDSYTLFCFRSTSPNILKFQLSLSSPLLTLLYSSYPSLSQLIFNMANKEFSWRTHAAPSEERQSCAMRPCHPAAAARRRAALPDSAPCPCARVVCSYASHTYSRAVQTPSLPFAHACAAVRDTRGRTPRCEAVCRVCDLGVTRACAEMPPNAVRKRKYTAAGARELVQAAGVHG